MVLGLGLYLPISLINFTITNMIVLVQLKVIHETSPLFFMTMIQCFKILEVTAMALYCSASLLGIAGLYVGIRGNNFRGDGN
jgi:hypothetical protein